MTLLKTHIEFRSDNFPQTAEEMKSGMDKFGGTH